MAENPTISILGCGWLGLPLAQNLVQLGWSVKGSSTHPDKLDLLERSKITPYLITVSPQLAGDDPGSFFRSKVLFLNIPFSRKLTVPAYYNQQIDAVIEALHASPVEFVIFASSTSVYPETVKDAREDLVILADNQRAKVLLNAEGSLLAQKRFATTVIRFAGLYGGERKIGRMLAGRKDVPEGGAPMNLIHLQDCVNIVLRILEQNVRGEIFNACSDGHPTKERIYTAAAAHYGFEAPQFADRPAKRVKVVNNAKLKNQLKYTFKHPDPMDFAGV